MSVTTLDLLEECLDQIHKCRKANLVSKARRFQRQEDLRRKKLQSSQERLRTPKNKNRVDDDDFGDEFDEPNLTTEMLGQKLAQKIKSVPLQSPLPLLGSSSVKNFMNTLNSTPTQSQPPIGSNDSVAIGVAREFQEALIQWWRDNPQKRSDEDSRIQFADYLSDYFMCQKLDGLPTSQVISSLRKEISRIIESFANDGEIPSDFNSLKLENLSASIHPVKGTTTTPSATTTTSSSPPNPSILTPSSLNSSSSSSSTIGNPKKSSSSSSTSLPPPSAAHSALNSSFSTNNKYKSQPNTSSNSSSSSASSSSSSTTTTPSPTPSVVTFDSVMEKKQAEKDRIKKQYEEYMKQKNHAEKHKEKEYEDLNDDIRSLLTTLKKK